MAITTADHVSAPPSTIDGLGVVTVARWTFSVQPTCTDVRQIGAELGVPWTTVSWQPRQAGVTMRRGGPSAHAASTDQILHLRDQDLSWTEIANR
jgi:hypothetical protein